MTGGAGGLGGGEVKEAHRLAGAIANLIHTHTHTHTHARTHSLTHSLTTTTHTHTHIHTCVCVFCVYTLHTHTRNTHTHTHTYRERRQGCRENENGLEGLRRKLAGGEGDDGPLAEEVHVVAANERPEGAEPRGWGKARRVSTRVAAYGGRALPVAWQHHVHVCGEDGGRETAEAHGRQEVWVEEIA